MNYERLNQILNETTVQLRKGDVVSEKDVGPLRVVTIDAMPHVDEAAPSLVKVDMEMLVIGVDREVAERHRAELISLLDDYPDPKSLREGPSYLGVGAVLGDQGAAFQLFALGEVLGLWKIFSPGRLGLKGERANMLAGMGLILISGYKHEEKTTETGPSDPAR